MTTKVCSPDQSLQYLTTLSENYIEEKKNGHTWLSDVSDVRHPFTAPQTRFSRMFASSRNPSSMEVGGEEGKKIIHIKRNDLSSNLEAIRTLFRFALSEQSQKDSLMTEEMMGKSVNFVFEVDRHSKDKVQGETCSEILASVVRNRLSATKTLDELNHILSKASTAMALSLDIAESVRDNNRVPPLYDLACSQAQALCENSSSHDAALFAAVIRKLNDDAIVSVALHLKNDAHLSEEERTKLFQYNWCKVWDVVQRNFSKCPPWVSSCIDVQSTASLLKCWATLGMPKLSEGIQQLIDRSNGCTEDAEREMYIGIYKDLLAFFENTMQTAKTLDDKLLFDKLIWELKKKSGVIRAAIDSPQSSFQQSRLKTEKVVKKILFQVAGVSHQVLSRAFGAAFTAGLAGVLQGKNLTEIALSILIGAGADFASNVVEMGVTNAMDHLPCTAINKSRIRNYFRCLAPILKIFIFFQMSSWLSRQTSAAQSTPQEPSTAVALRPRPLPGVALPARSSPASSQSSSAPPPEEAPPPPPPQAPPKPSPSPSLPQSQELEDGTDTLPPPPQLVIPDIHLDPNLVLPAVHAAIPLTAVTWSTMFPSRVGIIPGLGS